MWQLHGALDTARLHAAWRQLVATTPMLRTRFDLQALPQPQQVVEPTAELPFGVSAHPDCTSVRARERLAQQVMATERAELSDLESAPLLRVRVLQFGADEHTMLLSIHHIIEDGWSLRLLVDAVAHGYNTPGVPLPPPPSYEVKLRHEAALSTVPGSASEAFWQQAVHSLPSTARPIPAGLGALKMCCSETATGVATRRRCVLDSAVLQRLRTLAVQERVTIAALCHTAWAIVQWVYEGADADEVVFGCALSGRTAPVPQLAQVIRPLMTSDWPLMTSDWPLMTSDWPLMTSD
jgi:hypothetical protein